MRSFLKKIIPFLPILLVVLTSIFVAVSTYKPGTILSGWDTLHPEFNLKLYSERIFFGAWQEHQGLGSAAAQAHLAELPRLPILWLLTNIFDTNLVRYIFILSMYVLGGISTYWYIKHVWFKKSSKKYYSSISAALGSLLYLFNLGTLQQFHVPLEMFAVHFATFGLVLGSLHLFIEKGNKKHAIFLFLIQILAAPAAHTATLFYVYTMLIIGYGLLFSILNKNKFIKYFKRLLISITLIIIANAYWIGPNLYYVINHNQEIQEAKINRNFSDEAFWQNQAFGEVKNVVIFKNFLFNWKIYDHKNQEFIEMFGDWSEHLENTETTLSWFLGIILLSGIILSLGSKKRKKTPLLLIFLLGFLFLNNLNWPSTELYKFIVSLSNTLKEALRFPFTKFSIVFIFAASVYFAEFSNFLLGKISSIKKEKIKIILLSIVVISLTTGIIYPMKHLFEGKLISDKVKVEIPEEYFEMFTWFETQPKTQKIAMFPILDFWPWTYYDWATNSNGYQGGGFLWFGLQQPLLNREFDRWATQNEFFYHEMNNAVQKNDSKQFKQVLQKYDVSWLIYDNNIIDPQAMVGNKTTKTDLINQQKIFKEIIAKQNNITLEKIFGNIEVYYISTSTTKDSSNLEKIGSLQKKVLKDVVYDNHGNYVVDSSFNTNYLFSNLHSEISTKLVERTHDSWNIQNEVKEYDKLKFPNWRNTDSFLPLQVFGNLDEGILTLTIKNILPILETSNNQYQLSDFADNQQISIKNKLSFLDDYYHVDIAKQTTVLDPKISQNQKLGTAFVKSNQDLEIIISASYDERIQKIIIPKEDIDSLFPKEMEIPLDESGDKVTISYQEPLSNILTKKINPNQSYFEQNCSDKGSVDFIEKQNSRIFTAVNGGATCQGFLINNLPPTDGYLLNLEVKNISGPNLYVQINEMNKTKIFFQEALQKNDSNMIYGLFPQNNNDLSFVAHNRSFGSFSVENNLKKIELLPLPFEYIENITARKSSYPNLENKYKRTFELELKKSSWHYWRKKEENNPEILLLKQSYDDGWIAVSLNNPIKILPHYRYNSWANAWEINSNSNRVIIFFWPQLMVWLGFISIIGATAWLTRYNLINKNSKPLFSWKKIRKVFYEEKI